MSSFHSTVKKTLLNEATKSASNVNRVVVIDHTGDEKNFGRVLDKSDVAVKLSYQDDGKTLKVFITKDSNAASKNATSNEDLEKGDPIEFKSSTGGTRYGKFIKRDGDMTTIQDLRGNQIEIHSSRVKYSTA